MTTRHSAGRLVFAVMVAGLAAGPRAVQAVDPTSPLADRLLSCVGLEDDGERLACFDDIAAPLAGVADEQAEAAAREVFRGQDDWDSEPIQLQSPWRVTWTNKGNIMTVELHDSAGQLVSVIGNQIGSGGGSSDILPPGEWRLAVRSIGAWELRVLEEEGS